MSAYIKLQDKFLKAFFAGRFSQDFYLTGGTALAKFYFQHRESFDLDFFTQEQEIDFNEVNLEMVKIIERLGLKIEKQTITDTFLQYIVKDKRKTELKIDLVKDIPVHFGIIQTKNKVRFDSLKNIGSNKILAIFGRVDPKDFVDLFFILNKTNLSFKKLYEMAKQKDLGLSEFFLANSILKIKETKILPKMLVDLDRKEMIAFYEALAKKLFLKIKPKN
ncbi:hypothetical protein A2630_05015 [Candidatus Woesebacteria bacterium RIFCSPHIGHO2_01_FULL_44_10]|uniref:Nucleotidyl transferase AbiEii/AbiGii toxin family protein n=1 Tax=Candidatus Woesebacteria bacterium RIFCSPLOWO2_01_FULL_44_14 TaxID=1802525 RepID=A0A1F8C2J9_9BACT|nr:MAG: hypothetical protein A2630_05015 [Candidatus Woesebacteria bacterium RIFCSPHIGHO2_01_FULL_44_10]OGM53713.1 MAG: hypothetical protein A3F62_03550 [Candidatus Woesebacteria bacterium RIFCSPHIGHO2_12_FULL_44_11]OGM70059.1 MAG: hypothetical protein A2975_03215 [Candidatus Woesebacteria bacterium RIFCSPLOWO2_01_FULL_44_14]